MLADLFESVSRNINPKIELFTVQTSILLLYETIVLDFFTFKIFADNKLDFV